MGLGGLKRNIGTRNTWVSEAVEKDPLNNVFRIGIAMHNFEYLIKDRSMKTGSKELFYSGIVFVFLASSALAMYCPETGRFLQRDPIEYVDAMNLYEYVQSNVILWVDPLGFIRTKAEAQAAAKNELERRERTLRYQLQVGKQQKVGVWQTKCDPKCTVSAYEIVSLDCSMSYHYFGEHEYEAFLEWNPGYAPDVWEPYNKSKWETGTKPKTCMTYIKWIDHVKKRGGGSIGIPPYERGGGNYEIWSVYESREAVIQKYRSGQLSADLDCTVQRDTQCIKKTGEKTSYSEPSSIHLSSDRYYYRDRVAGPGGQRIERRILETFQIYLFPPGGRGPIALPGPEDEYGACLGGNIEAF
jgi:hypothetical protein